MNHLQAAKDALYAEYRTAGKRLKAKYPRQANGLTPDHIKFSPEYRADKAKVDKLFQALRKINTL